ncbi:hypothetical protein G6L90_06640 [Agrobacterium tumefaciens]|uniref:hypothetical protein n=1 Tax=Agrobacterium tumefaciens TaxID=358 RepID=UPI0015740165|nr:hypothetical protein [Agrobacterium tumefaciens]WHO22633.1 hypothetical protein G6L90_06640 [Agrobacterium tumefaciens]
MTAPVKHLSVADIEARIAEISAKQEEHSRRDLDAELRDVMRSGGDIDALENAHLDAERQSRRLRVERQALEADLPLAKKREGETLTRDKVDQHRKLAADAAKAVDRVVSAWEAFVSALDAWDELRRRSATLTDEAWSISQSSGAEMPIMGKFTSERIKALAPQAHHDIVDRLAAAEGQQQVGFGVQGYRVDS